MSEVMPPFNNNTKDFQRSGSQTMTTNGRNGIRNGNGVTNKNKISLNSEPSECEQTYQPRIVWWSVFKISVVHLIALYGVWCAITSAKYETVIWMFIVAVSASFGILSGAHRLWSHKCYKAHSSLRILLMILQTLALQNDIYEWSRDHRVHHKYSETDADPHNSNRGFFFAHMDWLMTKKHPQVIEKGRQLDMSDLLADTVVRFQRKYYVPLVLLIWGVLPTVIPYYLWSEGLLISFASNMLRYVLSLHQSWLVNSAAHLFGFRPYDKGIASRENQSVVYLSFGEGYHNYHHTFPYDYSASEFGWKSNFNLATAFIDFFAMLGLAYDLKKASDKTISERQERTGEKIKGLQKNTLLDYMIGLVITIWPLWVTYISRTIYRYFFENVSYVY